MTAHDAKAPGSKAPDTSAPDTSAPDTWGGGRKESARRALRGLIAAGTLACLLTTPLTADADPGDASPTTSSAGEASSAPNDQTSSTGPSEASPSAGSAARSETTPEASAEPKTSAPASSAPGSGVPGSSAPGIGEPSGETPASSADQNSGSVAAAAEGSSDVALSVAPAGTPVAGHYYQDIGTYAFSGTVGADDATATVAIYQRATSGTTWTQVSSAPSDDDGAFSASLPVTSYGSFTFAATIGGSPSAAGSIVSNEVAVVVENASIVLDKPVTSIDALKDPTVKGRVVPARAGVAVIVEVKKSGSYVQTASATTAADGSYSAVIAYGHSHLATYQFRTRYVPANRPTRVEASTTYSIKRAAVTNAVIANTTSADVAKTYHAGCPVGPSKLRTISINFYGFDKVMHRGVIIVRKDLTTKIVRGFSAALSHRYPIAKMNNPNVYGGDDPTQMAANNTSGFNCRKVVGNPYKQSPHSYGIAIDVNTVQNPYRDSKGKWWPKNGKKYVKRTPHKKGMLTKNSSLTKSLRKDKFFWGGLWYPGRDYQHYEYRG